MIMSTTLKSLALLIAATLPVFAVAQTSTAPTTPQKSPKFSKIARTADDAWFATAEAVP